jgi:hypothetical protein
MANKLKIAKASFSGPLTDTTATTNVITVDTTFYLTRGDRFVPASTVGGLTGGTTYYVDEVLSSTTFTALTKSWSVQPHVSPTLTTTTGQTVILTFNQVDEGYPSDTPQDMGVVGGDTQQYSKQLTAFGAIAIANPGAFWFDTSTTDVYGDKTADFDVNIAVGEQLSFTGDNIPFVVGALVTGVTYVINNTVGTSAAQWIAMGATGANLGEVFIATAAGAGTGSVSYASSSANVPLGTVASIDTVSTATASSDAGTDLITVTSTAAFDLDAPIWFAATIGGLSADTTYFVKTIDSGTTFGVSATLGGTALALTTTTVVSTANIEKLTLGAVSTFTKSAYSGIVGAADEAVYILRQKGKRKYLVSNGPETRQGICTLVNKAQADLLAGEMSIQGTYDNAATTYIESISDVNGLPFDNDSGSPLTQADQTGMQATFETIAGTPLAGSVKPVIKLPSA